MKKFKKFCFAFILILLVVAIFITSINNKEIKTIKNDKDLYSAYKSSNYRELSFIERILLLPFSIFQPRVYYETEKWETVDDFSGKEVEAASNSAQATGNDFSTTNIQVEGVDEADIIKTDGKYIYSISDDSVLITNAENPENVEVIARIKNGSSIPIDLLLYNNLLVVISANKTSYKYESWYYSTNVYNTVVNIYDISNKEKPKSVKSFELYEPYNTTRCIDGNLYILSNGSLRAKDGKVDRKYKEDGKTKELAFNNIKYINGEKKPVQTLIANYDLNNLQSDINLSSYLIDMSNAYVSIDNIYLVDVDYSYSSDIKVSDIFGLKGIFGAFEGVYDNDYSTKVFKFKMDKGIEFVKSSEVDGRIINQYSLDEHDDNLRMAVETDEGTQVVVLDDNLKKIGETEKVADGERMYASRFMGDKAYLVTFENTDPLFVIDLSDPKNPEVLGELEIPGYSTYLHPYDENHLIGIGMNTEERVNKDSYGNVTSSWTEIVGMKMALFDVSDVNNPVEIDSVPIGDRRTASAVLTNPKALLFSKQKKLLAIPVNDYLDDFSVESSDSYDDDIYYYTDYMKDYVSEGYFVYNIDLNGFDLKGTITHDKSKRDYYNYYEYKLLRGLYIGNNLFTVSEDYIKVNKLDDLSQISSLNLKGVK